MTDVVVSSEDVIVQVQQPTVPSTAPPPKVGLVEINQVTQRGSAWMTGHGPPTAAGGQFGDMYLDMDTGDVYLWDGTEWDFQGTFAPSTLTGAEILAELITVDGAGSGLDADLLDGQEGVYYATQSDMSAVEATNSSQDTQIATNNSKIAANTTNIANNTTAINTNATAISTETTNRTNADAALQSNINLKANIASPVFTGDPQAPTASVGDNDQSIATTQFVTRALSALPPSGIPEAPNDGLTYGRKNLAWATVVGGAAPSDTPPPGPLVNGQLWWKSSSGVFYIYYNDGNSSQWVQAAASTASQPGLADIDMQGHAILNTGNLGVATINGHLPYGWEAVGDVLLNGVPNAPVLNLSAYRKIHIFGTLYPTANAVIGMRVSSDNGSTWISTATYQHQTTHSAGTTVSASRVSNSILYFADYAQDGGALLTFDATIDNFNNTIISTGICQSNGQNTSNQCLQTRGLIIGGATAWNAILFVNSVPTNLTGHVIVEGWRG